MADPLSITAAVLGTLDASIRISGKLGDLVQVWKDAPAEIYALYNEISDLSVVLDHARMARKSLVFADPGGKVGTDLGRLLGTAQNTTTTLEELLNEMMALPRFKKRALWVKRKSSIATKKDELREVRSKINDILVAHNMWVSYSGYSLAVITKGG